jgi:hypothetical protein
LPRKPHWRTVVVVVLVVGTLVVLDVVGGGTLVLVVGGGRLVLVVGGGGRLVLVVVVGGLVLVVVGGLVLVVVGGIVLVVDGRLVLVVVGRIVLVVDGRLVLVVVGRIVLVVDGRLVLVVGVGGVVVDGLVDVELVLVEFTVAVVLDVVGVGGRVLLVTLVVVGRVPGGRLVVVVLAPTIGFGHAFGAGALCATKRPGLSLPILPPKRKQWRRVPVRITTDRAPCASSSSVMPSVRVTIFSPRLCLTTIVRTSEPGPVSTRLWKRNTVPRALTDQSRADVVNRARSPVPGLLISSSPPTSVGSSVLPGSGATTPCLATRTSCCASGVSRRMSLLPGRRTSSARARPRRPMTTRAARLARRWFTRWAQRSPGQLTRHSRGLPEQMRGRSTRPLPRR